MCRTQRDRFAKYSESFQREAEVLARLNHPNIIRMYGLVTEPIGDGPPSAGALGAAFSGPQPQQPQIIAGIMMEYVRGGSLAQRFRTASQSGWRLSLRDRCRIALQAALGMSYLHDQSPAVIHFDLKPDNLLVDGEGEDTFIKVADFGLSKHKFNNYVTCHDLRGTLPYMAPELVANPTKVCVCARAPAFWCFWVSGRLGAGYSCLHGIGCCSDLVWHTAALPLPPFLVLVC